MNNQPGIGSAQAIGLLEQLISTPSFSKQEDQTASVLEKFFDDHGVKAQRSGNNVFALNKYFDEKKPTILLNSHHDTVKPNPKYTRDPFVPQHLDGKLFGLGSNDAGGCLVSLIATFLNFYQQEDLKYNIIIACTAEEEISGTGGIESVLPHLPPVDSAIIGEPTQMQMATAEMGLMVIDCVNHGRAGHAARNEGDNAITKAMKDIGWFNSFSFDRVSDLLGPNKMTVTVIETENKAHNVVPSECRFVVDTRINELYDFEEVLKVIREHVDCDVAPRSTRLRSSLIEMKHPMVQAGLKLGRTCYGSPTTSDKALVPFPALKMGPGDSARSHTADEYIYTKEIEKGIDLYIRLLKELV